MTNDSGLPRLRSGSWNHHRDYFAWVHDKWNATGEQIMTYLINNAAFEDSVFSFRDRTEITIRRGQTVMSRDSLAEYTDRSRSKVDRTLRALEGELFDYVEKGRKLRRGLGTGPSIVSIRNFERFTRAATKAKSERETWVETIEGESHLERDLVVDIRSPSPDRSRRSSPRDLLRRYRQIGSIDDEEAALNAISNAIQHVGDANDLWSAVEGYGFQLRQPSGSPARPPTYTAERFFTEVYTEYLTRRNGNDE